MTVLTGPVVFAQIAQRSPLPISQPTTPASIRLAQKFQTAYDNKRWAQVVALTTQAIKLEAEKNHLFSRAYIYRGIAFEKLGQTAAAIADYKKIPPRGEDGAFAKARLKILDPEPTPKPTPKPTPVPHQPEPAPTPVTLTELPSDPIPVVSPASTWDMEATLKSWGNMSEPGVVVPQAHPNPITALAVSPDGKLGASGSWQRGKVGEGAIGVISLWHLNTSSATPPAVTVYSNRVGDWATVWNGKGAPPAFFGHFGRVSCLSFSEGGAILASGGVGGGITLWAASDGRPLRALRDEKALSKDGSKAPAIMALGWQRDEDGPVLWAVDADGMLFGWHWPDGNAAVKAISPRTLAPPGIGGTGWAAVAAFSPRANQLALADGRGNIGVYDTTRGTRLASVNNSRNQEIRADGSGGEGIAVVALAFSPSGAFLASANFAHVYLNAFPTNSGEAPATPAIPLRFENRLTQLKESVRALLWADERSLLVRSATNLTVLQAARLREPNALRPAALVGSVPAPPITSSQPAEAFVSPRAGLFVEAVPLVTGNALRALKGVVSDG